MKIRRTVREEQKQKDDIHRLLAQPRWKVSLFRFALRSLALWQLAIDYYYYVNFNFLFARRAFVKRTSQRAHWVGRVEKPHKLASSALAGVLVAGVFVAPHPLMALQWSAVWGSVFSLFVIYRSVNRVIKYSQNP